MFTNGTVSLQSVRSSSRHAARKSLAEIASSCDSLGIADENPNQFLEIVSVSSTEIRANSNLCYTGHAANPIDLLRPLSHACLTGAFNHRHFEVCLTEPEAEFRLIQPTHRMNHPWPTALPMTGLSEANWTFDVASRSLQRKFKTNQGCKRLQPALTEEFTVTIMTSGRLSLKAVSGSFSPMVFPSNFIEGVLHHDPRHKNGCSSNAFESGTPKEPWIALVDRGGCMFQDKALVAQAKGAAGVIVINNNRKGMIPAMAAIVGKPVVDIPTVLTDVDGAVLRKHIGTRVQIAPASLEGHPSPSEDDKLHVSLRIGCRSIEEGYSRSCQVGDEVLAQFDGDLLKHPVQIIQKLNPDSYIVKSTSGSHETAMGYQLFRDSNSPCTVQLGSFIEAIERTDTCELVVDIHSALLCGDSRFREPLFKKNDIECTLT
ncbi:hypothetical protein C9890_0353 [Perkinsus sp. BL_2016]|nr:hypothetical protein C9890_0353 [Perkinsus sp. BL_2016]